MLGIYTQHHTDILEETVSLSHGTAFVFMIGVAFFGGPFAWIMILLTHLAFRYAMAGAQKEILRFAPPGPWSSLFGLAALVAVLISTWWVLAFHVTLLAGPPWVIFITLCYLVWKRAQRSPASGTTCTVRN